MKSLQSGVLLPMEPKGSKAGGVGLKVNYYLLINKLCKYNLRNFNGRYKPIIKTQSFNVVDDMKIVVKNFRKLETLIETVKIFS